MQFLTIASIALILSEERLNIIIHASSIAAWIKNPFRRTSERPVLVNDISKTLRIFLNDFLDDSKNFEQSYLIQFEMNWKYSFLIAPV